MRIPQSDHVLSLFSGAGGFSYGFACAGLRPLCGVDIDPDASRSYETNVGSPCHRADLAQLDPGFFRNILGGKAPLALIGGPPCQGFSTAGSRTSDDPRNRLIFHYLHLVEALQPRWFFFENVEGLLTSGQGDAVAALVREFLRIGYSVRLEKVNLAGYGVPQTRKRVLIIGNRLGIDFQMPDEQCSYDSGKARKHSGLPFAPTLLDAVQGLGTAITHWGRPVAYTTLQPLTPYDALMREGNVSGTVSAHTDSTCAEDAHRYSLLGAGQSMKDLPEAYWHESFRRRAFRRVQDGTPTERRGGAPSGIKRLHGDLQSLTITGAACREFIHPTLDRPLTIRECARLQSFPDRYAFCGNAASVMQQIGNAVPPLAAAVLARHLMTLEGRIGSDLQSLPHTALPRLLGYRLTEATGMSPALKRTESLLRELSEDGQQAELAFH